MDKLLQTLRFDYLAKNNSCSFNFSLLQIKQNNWVEFLSDFLEMEDRECNSTCVGTIKRGHYGLLDVHRKLQILRELVVEALETNAIRDKLDERFEQQQALEAVKREEARKKKEELLKMVNSDLEAKEGNIMENGSSNGHIPSLNEINVNHSEEVHLPDKNQTAENGYISIIFLSYGR